MATSHARYRRKEHAEAYAKHLQQEAPGKQQAATFAAVPDPLDPFYFTAVLATFPNGRTAYVARTYGWRYRRQQPCKSSSLPT